MKDFDDSEGLKEALEELVLDPSALTVVERRFVGFNVFEAIGHTHAEERHSSFLAFLLDPRGSHGLGDAALREFILGTVGVLPRSARPVELIEIALADLSSTLVLREHRNIDIFAVNDEEKFIIVIENKVRSREHSDQLQRYRQYAESQYPHHQKIFVYLTPDGDSASDGAYIPYSYGEIAALVEQVASEHRGTVADSVSSTLEQYLQILRRHVVSDDELVRMARSIYQKHKRALDFIFEQKPDLQQELRDILVGMIKGHDAFVVDRDSKTFIDFAPRAWGQLPRFNTTPLDMWTRSGRSVLLGFRNDPTSVKLYVMLGPTEDQQFREDIFDYCKSLPGVFKNVNKKLTPKFATLFSKQILGRQHFDGGDLPELERRIEKVWKEFVEGDLPKIERAFLERFGE